MVLNKFKDKRIDVILIEDAKKQYVDLLKITRKEQKDGRVGTEQQKLLNSIKQAIQNLKENPISGIHIPRDRIPKEYCKKFDVCNLWKSNLIGAWRLIYTLEKNKVEIISIVIDILNHKRYNKKFKYKKK